jgi:hypothetical protein
MTKPSTIHPLLLAVGALFLVSIVGIRVSAADDIAADTQQQAANVLQPPTLLSGDTGDFYKPVSGDYQALTPHQQAQRVLQPSMKLTPAGSTL